MHIFIDESGDLGFQFAKHGTSQYFVITALVVDDQQVRALQTAVSRTLRVKVNKKKSRVRKHELKGTDTSIDVKRYLLRCLKNSQFRVFSVILDKSQVPLSVQETPDWLYDHLTGRVVGEIPFDQPGVRIQVEIDRSKGHEGRLELNRFLRSKISARVSQNVPIYVDHVDSQVSKPVQVADMLGHGLFRKYQSNDTEWYSQFLPWITSESLAKIELP